MESVNDMRIKNGLMLLLTAFIWGTAFVAQSVGMDYLEDRKIQARKRICSRADWPVVCYCLRQAVFSRSVLNIRQRERPDLSPLFIS